MSKRDTSLDPKIIESAKKEFLDKGYLESSLGTICFDAGVTTGAIYRRYEGKEGLFFEVVKPAINVFEKLKKETIDENEKRKANNRMKDSYDSYANTIKRWIELLYSEKESMKILMSKSEGTKYYNYLHDFTEENVNISYNFMKELEEKNMCKINVSYKEFHVLLTSYWSAIFELIIHDFTKEQALIFSEKIVVFFSWENIIEF